MPKTNSEIIADLKTDLQNLDTLYNGVYQSPDSVFALQKTIQSFNITVTDWNTLLTYINSHRSSLDGLIEMYPDFVDAFEEITNNLTADIDDLETSLSSGTFIVDKATKDASGNVITLTYETKSAALAKLDEANAYTVQEVGKIKSGAYTSKKAEQDGLGQDINGTYELKTDAASKANTQKSYTDQEINKLKGGTYTSKKAEQDKDGNVIDTTYVKHSQVVDSFSSDSSTDPLSAAKGKELKQAIDTINSILSSDDTDLDTMQEIVDFIQNNKDVIDTISTTKVNYTDIVDALNSSATNKVLSANQGRALKALIDAIVAGTTVVGNATNAVNATNDSSGNKIDEYYFSHEEGFSIGLVSVDEYNEHTGIITLRYHSDAISDITYNEHTGIVTFTY